MTRTSLPPRASLDLEQRSYDPGLVGLVQAIGTSVRWQGSQLDDTELLGISSAAFCNYVFEPQFNQHEDSPREFSLLAELFSNYGPWESISYYDEYQIGEVSHLKGAELLKLVAFEIAHGRPLVTLDRDLEPRLITGYSISSSQRRVELDDGSEVDLGAEQRIQGEDDTFHNWLLLVRQAPQPEWAATRSRQRVDVLRWSAEHGRNRREFFQETGENYAPGLLAVDSFRRFLAGVSDPASASYAERHVRRLHAARTAAAECLRRWSDDVAEEVGKASVAEELEVVAERYAEVAEALATADNFADAFEQVEPLERAALAALVRAERYFPSAFEA